MIGDKCRGKRYLDTNTPSNKSLEGTAKSPAFMRETCTRRSFVRSIGLFGSALPVMAYAPLMPRVGRFSLIQI